MNNYEEWAHLVAKKLQGEADVIAAIDKEELDDGAATEAFVRTVLTPFLPENYGVGAGRVVDAFGNRSEYMDVVIYNRSFPRIGLRGTQSDYLYESVLASFAIRAKYVRKTFFESMDACASMARLTTNVDKTVLVQLARRNGLKPGPNQSFVHEDALRTARFELIGSPPAFMFGFTGIKYSYHQLQENIELWIKQRTEENRDLPMRAFPAVIATQGCFAWRNAAPLALSSREMLGIGNDVAPIRMIVLQLLYLLNRRLHVTTDGYGLKPNLSGYLSQFKPPKFELGIGDVDALTNPRLGDGNNGGGTGKSFQPARDHADKAADEKPVTTTRGTDDKPAADAAPAPQSEPVKSAAKPAQKVEPAPLKKATAPVSEAKPAQPAAKPAKTTAAPDTPTSENAATSSGVFDKPSPFASAPPPPKPEKDETAAAPAPRAPMATLGSAPIPGLSSSTDKDDAPSKAPAPIPGQSSSVDKDEAPAKPATAPLGSAPIPPAQKPPAAKPPSTPVDIEVTGDIPLPAAGDKPDFESTMVMASEAKVKKEKASQDKTPRNADGTPDFESTMVIAPDATLSKKAEDSAEKPAASSTDAFIDRVKEQLSDAEDNKDKDKDKAYISTTPV